VGLGGGQDRVKRGLEGVRRGSGEGQESVRRGSARAKRGGKRKARSGG